MVKIKDFITYLNAQVKNNSLYIWGGQGEYVLNMKPATIIAKETSHTNAGRVLRLLSERVKNGADMSNARYFDCSGLGVYWFLENELITTDTTANGLKNLCDIIPIDKTRAGDMVFKVDSRGKASHVGYVVDNKGNVIESAGRDIGVVKSTIESGKFTVAGRPRFNWK